MSNVYGLLADQWEHNTTVDNCVRFQAVSVRAWDGPRRLEMLECVSVTPNAWDLIGLHCNSSSIGGSASCLNVPIPCHSLISFPFLSLVLQSTRYTKYVVRLAAKYVVAYPQKFLGSSSLTSLTHGAADAVPQPENIAQLSPARHSRSLLFTGLQFSIL